MELSDSTTFHSSLGLKLKRGGRGRPVLEGRAGDDYSQSRAKWVHLERTIDRENDRYMERVIDEATGEVIHEVDQPLSAHRGHGSAKVRKA